MFGLCQSIHQSHEITANKAPKRRIAQEGERAAIHQNTLKIPQFLQKVVNR